MGKLITYLTFNGNCKEAMEFYKDCLGGKLHFQTLETSPQTEKLPEYAKAYIVQACLTKENFVLMGTDMSDEKLIQGNSVSILLNCNDENEIKNYYKNLKVDGKETYPLLKNDLGDFFGGVTDKYGHQWLFYCQGNNN